MDTETLKKWKEYKEAIDKENEPALTLWRKWQENDFKRYKKREKQYEAELAAWKKKKEKRLAEINEFKKLPLYKRIGKEEPGMPYTLYYGRPYPPMFMSLGFPILKQATWEGFLNWLIEPK